MISRSAAHAVSRNVATFQRHAVSHCVNLKKLQKTDPDHDFSHFYQSNLSMCCYVNILPSYRWFSSKSKSAWYEVVGVCLMLMRQLAIWALAPWQLPPPLFHHHPLSGQSTAKTRWGHCSFPVWCVMIGGMAWSRPHPSPWEGLSHLGGYPQR